MLKKSLIIDPVFSDNDPCMQGGFREQIAVLWPGSMQCSSLLAHKSLLKVCDPVSADFCAEGTTDGLSSWKNADFLISQGACGFYHTHPEGCNSFSDQDWKFIEALAQANGKRYIWHVMQSANTESAQCVCASMKQRGFVNIFDFGYIHSLITDSIISLPLPPYCEQRGPLMVIQIGE